MCEVDDSSEEKVNNPNFISKYCVMSCPRHEPAHYEISVKNCHVSKNIR